MPERDTTPTTPAATQVCPYCGHLSSAPSAVADPCPKCQMRDTPETRAATTARVGPWYLLQPRNPTSPGMNFTTLLSLVRRGRITPTSVVRGPTTQQLWALASRVKGLSREFGICYACGQALERSSNLCPHCQRLQDPPLNPDALLEHKPAPAAQRPRRPSPPPSVGLPPGTLAAASDNGHAPSNPERILTPRELAAAFALTPQTPANTAAGNDPPTTAKAAPKRHPIRTVLLTAILFAACTLGAYAAIDPEFRTQASATVAHATGWARSQLTARPPAPAAVPAPTQHQESPPPRPATRPIQPAAPTSAPTISIEVSPPAKPVAPSPPKPTAEDVGRSIDLFRQALQAESSNDFPAAVKLYEQVKTLPREAWPATLERRLAAARLRADKGGN